MWEKSIVLSFIIPTLPVTTGAIPFPAIIMGSFNNKETLKQTGSFVLIRLFVNRSIVSLKEVENLRCRFDGIFSTSEG